MDSFKERNLVFYIHKIRSKIYEFNLIKKELRIGVNQIWKFNIFFFWIVFNGQTYLICFILWVERKILQLKLKLNS